MISHVNISRVAVEDGGVYVCMVKNRAGRDQHSARLNIYGKSLKNTLTVFTINILTVILLSSATTRQVCDRIRLYF